MDKKPLFVFRSFRKIVTFLVLAVVVIVLGNHGYSFQNGSAQHPMSPLLSQIPSACESTKQAVVREIMAPLKPNPKTETQRQINLYRTSIRKIFLKDAAKEWESLLMLDKLQESLRKDETDLELLDSIIDILDGDASDMQRPYFVRLKNSLVSNRPFLWRQNQQSHLDEVEAAFDSLPGLLDCYLKSQDVATAEAVSTCLQFLAGTPATDDLIAMIRRLVMKPNVKVRVSSTFVAPFFLREVDEPVTINDMILGTWVRGSGHLTGRLYADYVPSRDSAVIRVTLEGQIDSKTVGANGPVRVPSTNVTKVKSVKDIIIRNDSIKTTPAKTDAKLSSQIGQVGYTRPAPMVRLVAPQQIIHRKPATDAESERLTRLRLNARFNSEVDQTVEGFEEILLNYGNCRRDGKNLHIQSYRMATTKHDFLVDAIVGNKYQLTTTTKPPTVTTRADLFLQLHESAADNTGTCEFSGKTLMEDQLVHELLKRFPKIWENREENDDESEPLLTIAFSDRPIQVSFKNNVIKAVVETTYIERAGNLYPGMVIEFVFRIEAADDGFRLVVAETPEVLPMDFDPEKGLSMRETAIRAIVKKKLDRLTEQPIEWKESVIEAKNGVMTLKPVHLSAKNGWLSVGLNLVEWSAKTEN